MVSLLPGLVVAAAIQVAARTEWRLRAALNLALAGAAALAVAAVWFAYSWRTVFAYLTAFGYGSQSNQGGQFPPGIAVLLHLRVSLGAATVAVFLIALARIVHETGAAPMVGAA